MPIHIKGAGGGALPTLTNPATDRDVRSKKQYIDADGNKKRGSLTDYCYTDVYFVLANAATTQATTCNAQCVAKIIDNGSTLDCVAMLDVEFDGNTTASMTYGAVYNMYGGGASFSTASTASKRVNCYIYNAEDMTMVKSFAITAADDPEENGIELKALNKTITLESGKTYFVQLSQST